MLLKLNGVNSTIWTNSSTGVWGFNARMTLQTTQTSYTTPVSAGVKVVRTGAALQAAWMHHAAKGDFDEVTPLMSIITPGINTHQWFTLTRGCRLHIYFRQLLYMHICRSGIHRYLFELQRQNDLDMRNVLFSHKSCSPSVQLIASEMCSKLVTLYCPN